MIVTFAIADTRHYYGADSCLACLHALDRVPTLDRACTGVMLLFPVTGTRVESFAATVGFVASIALAMCQFQGEVVE